ncbi:hypothetical protein AYO44_16090 [Planctomycetaceae bacterium SCGC AG-212-F19]|nr:hypothetical protein AYO44_16090 [Planctomycetaceae bacterium SCGC AG-212-F19]
MRGHPLALIALVGGLILASGGQGADPEEPLPQYPKAGAVIPGPFHVLNLNGERKGRYHCLVCKLTTMPVAGFLVRLKGEKDADDEGLKQLEPGQPLAKLLQQVDHILEKHPDGNMGGFVVFVGEKDGHVPIATRLFGNPDLKQEALVKELGIKNLLFAYDDATEKGMSYKYFAGPDKEAKDKERGRLIPADPFVKTLLYQNYKLLHDVRDFNKDKPLTDKDVAAIVADVDKMQPPPVVNRKKYKP